MLAAPAALWSSSVWHHTKGAKSITPFHNGHIGLVRIFSGLSVSLEQPIRVLRNIDDLRYPLFNLGYQLRNGRITARSYDQIHIGSFFEYLLSFHLRHTPQQSHLG